VSRLYDGGKSYLATDSFPAPFPDAGKVRMRRGGCRDAPDTAAALRRKPLAVHGLIVISRP